MQYLGIYFKNAPGGPPHGSVPASIPEEALGFDLPAFAEACLRFTPDLTVRSDGRGLFLEVSRCMKLYTIETLIKRLRILLAEWRFKPKDYVLAQGLTLPEAWVRARWGLHENPPIECIRDWIDPLGEFDEERRKLQVMIETLFHLGIRRERDLVKIPADSAVSRFGEMYETLLRHRDSGKMIAWERFRPRESLIERHEYSPTDGVSDLEPLLFTLKEMLDRMGKRLFGRGLALTALTLVLECEHRRNVLTNWSEIDLTFSFPQTQTKSILKILRERLSHEFRAKELLSPIIAVELQVKGTAPRRNVQRNFLDAKEEDAEKWRTFMTELGVKLSPDEYFLAELTRSYRPEKSYRRVIKNPEELEEFPLPYPERPLTLFTPPEELHRVGRFLLWREQRFTIEEFSELERISGEWWESDRGYSRTYFRVLTREDALLWIFRERGGGLFLHGLYRGEVPDGSGSGLGEKKSPIQPRPPGRNDK